MLHFHCRVQATMINQTVWLTGFKIIAYHHHLHIYTNRISHIFMWPDQASSWVPIIIPTDNISIASHFQDNNQICSILSVYFLCFCWIQVLSVYSDHCRAMGCGIEWTSPMSALTARPTSAQDDWDAPLQSAAVTTSEGRLGVHYTHRPGGRHPPDTK